MVNVGVCFDRLLSAPFVVDVAEVLEAADVDQLWVIEDCFYWAGMSLAGHGAGTNRAIDGALPYIHG